MNVFQFNTRFFTAVPNVLLNLVQSGKLKPRDVFTYAYLRAIVGPKDYTFHPLERMATELNESLTVTKESLSRLCLEGVIRRQRTVRNSKTTLLVRVKSRKERVAEAIQRRGIQFGRTAGNPASASVDFPPTE